VLPALPSNKKNFSDHHNSYNKGPNLALFSFTESPSNSLFTIKFPKNHITSSYHRNLPKIAKAIFGHQRALGVNRIFKSQIISMCNKFQDHHAFILGIPSNLDSQMFQAGTCALKIPILFKKINQSSKYKLQ
jgi:hypothetical protein